MTSPPEMAAVGTYPTRAEAERAHEHLSAAGFEPLEISQLSEAAWQLEAPANRREQALQTLQRREQGSIADAW